MVRGSTTRPPGAAAAPEPRPSSRRRSSPTAAAADPPAEAACSRPRPSSSSSARSSRPASAAAQAEALHDVGVDARVGGRVRADLGLEVRPRLRAAALRPRDGPRAPGCAARASRPARRCSSRSSARYVGMKDCEGRRRGGARRARRSGLGCARLPRAARVYGWRPATSSTGARVRRVLPQPLQPPARAAARRRARDGGAHAEDVDHRLRGCSWQYGPLPQPDHAPDPALRRHGDVPALEAPQDARGAGLPPGARAQRFAVAADYIGLAVALAVGMQVSSSSATSTTPASPSPCRSRPAAAVLQPPAR